MAALRALGPPAPRVIPGGLGGVFPWISPLRVCVRLCPSPPASPRDTWDRLHKDGGKRGPAPAWGWRGQLGAGAEP